MARSFLKTQNFCKDLWVEGVACSVYILNRSPTSSVQSYVPKEAWSGRKVIISHFWVFGCISFSHVPEKLRKKLDDRRKNHTFIRYINQSKENIFFNPITKRLVVSRDVQFLEDKSWNEMEDNTRPNPSILLDEHQASSTSTPGFQVQDKTSSSSLRSRSEIYEFRKLV